MTYNIHISGINCGHCSHRIENALSSHSQAVEVDFDSKMVKVDSERSSQEILAVLQEAGYPGTLAS